MSHETMSEYPEDELGQNGSDRWKLILATIPSLAGIIMSSCWTPEMAGVVAVAVWMAVNKLRYLRGDGDVATMLESGLVTATYLTLSVPGLREQVEHVTGPVTDLAQATVSIVGNEVGQVARSSWEATGGRVHVHVGWEDVGAVGLASGAVVTAVTAVGKLTNDIYGDVKRRTWNRILEPIADEDLRKVAEWSLEYAEKVFWRKIRPDWMDRLLSWRKRSEGNLDLLRGALTLDQHKVFNNLGRKTIREVVNDGMGLSGLSAMIMSRALGEALGRYVDEAVGEKYGAIEAVGGEVSGWTTRLEGDLDAVEALDEANIY